MELLDALKSQIKKVNNDRHYWLVRTMGGDFFEEFSQRGYIAIGYNEITIDEIKLANSYKEKTGEHLKTIIELKKLKSPEGEDINVQYAATQLLKFHNEINIGDIIIIPSRNSDFVVFASIESDVYEEKNTSYLTGICNFNKRRKIKVIRKLFRSKLNPKMIQMFNSRHIVSNVDNYAEFIDGSILNYYQKDDTTYLVLRVLEEDNLRALDFGIVPELVNLLKEYADENSLDINTDEVKAKICVQSVGDILMFAPSWESITIMGMFILLIKGGEMSFNKENGFKLKTGNILHSVSEFLDRRKDRQFKDSMKKKLDNMKIDTPDDFTKVMKEFQDKRESY